MIARSRHQQSLDQMMETSCWICNLSLITAVLQVSGNGTVNILGVL